MYSRWAAVICMKKYRYSPSPLVTGRISGRNLFGAVDANPQEPLLAKGLNTKVISFIS